MKRTFESLDEHDENINKKQNININDQISFHCIDGTVTYNHSLLNSLLPDSSIIRVLSNTDGRWCSKINSSFSLNENTVFEICYIIECLKNNRSINYKVIWKTIDSGIKFMKLVDYLGLEKTNPFKVYYDFINHLFNNLKLSYENVVFTKLGKLHKTFHASIYINLFPYRDFPHKFRNHIHYLFLKRIQPHAHQCSYNGSSQDGIFWFPIEKSISTRPELKEFTKKVGKIVKEHWNISNLKAERLPL